jgi:hypothetical protein
MGDTPPIIRLPNPMGSYCPAGRGCRKVICGTSFTRYIGCYSLGLVLM